jgi:hypothetical protein
MRGASSNMLNNFRNLQSLFGSHGTRWLLFRVSYALRRRTGYIRVQMPAYAWKDRPLGTWLKENVPTTPQEYARWRNEHSPKFFFEKLDLPPDLPWDPGSAVEKADRILSGEIEFFSHTWYKMGYPPDWHTDPVTGIRMDPKKHWAEISDDPGVDIKFIWEPSRFGMVYPLVRAYASTRDEKYAEAFWELIQSWVETNPPNTGANWMDGQEAALRLLAWTFGLYAFMDSPSTTSERIAQLTVMAAAHAGRIHRNIDYAISTHSNHTISEALGLWLAGLLFPELKEAEKYLALGQKLLEKEAQAQIFPDGSYSMFSLNYHRFILHLYLLAMRLGDLNDAPFSGTLKERVSKSIDYLAQLIDPETGQMPVYGSNDGALVLPLNNCDFTDYRPLLQLGSYMTKKQLLFDPGPWDEDVFWLYGATPLVNRDSQRGNALRASVRTDQQSSFPHGGTYVLRGSNSKAIIRCTDPHTRPSHADQLHIDLWIRGQNIACDAGTYLYSGEGLWRNGLAHTDVHNTVIVDHLDQMKMLTRFTWTNWSHGKVMRHEPKVWQGEHDGYRRLPDPAMHKRTVISLAGDRWLVVDHLTASKPHHYCIHWLLCDAEYGVQEQAPGFGLWLKPSGNLLPDSIMIRMGLLEGKGNFSLVRAGPNSARGWRSQYYGDKEPALSVLLETDQASACFWSYFGLEGDNLQIMNGTMKISSGDWSTTIDLDPLNK